MGELNVVVSERGMNLIWDGGGEIAQQVRRRHLADLLVQFDIGKFAGAIDGHEQIEFALGGLHPGDVDAEITGRIVLELLLSGLFAPEIRKPGNAVALQAAVQ